MSVRNFWISADIDGRRTRLEGGPRSRDGGFSLTIYIRDNGGILRAIEINGRARYNDELVLSAQLGELDAGDERVQTDERSFTVTTPAGRAPQRNRPAPRDALRDGIGYACSTLDPESRHQTDYAASLLQKESDSESAPLGLDPFGHPFEGFTYEEARDIANGT